MGKAKCCADLSSLAQPGFAGLGCFFAAGAPAKHFWAFVPAPPVSGAFAVVGAAFWGCPPGKLLSPELVHHFPRLPPGTHGFAGSAVPLAAGRAGQAFLASLLR